MLVFKSQNINIKANPMKQPCANCPFRSDIPFRGLTEGRVRSIVSSLHNDGLFPCHKTVNYSGSDEGSVTRDSKACIGSAIFMENTASESGGVFANVQYRMRARCEEFNQDDLKSNPVPVYTSLKAFLEGASS